MIEIIDVSKKFRIWEDRSRDLKETTINFLRGKKRSFREIWALQGIDLKIRNGETIAFIGENGSGKSTLLKLLGRVYAPDKGKIVAGGKISSLLELGVGFHPDLTGEENIYLNGAMLGFDRKEMEQRFDEIVSFSEVGDFVYSPIRMYSSGMLMRLGFSIATSAAPDILLVDEILAVGDEAFQEKCFERMRRFKENGKTIVLVSHSMEMVQKFCERAILLHRGRVVCDDVPDKTIEAYHETLYGPEYFLVGRRDGETAPTEEAGIEAEEAASGEEAAVEELPPEEAAEAEGPEESTATEEVAPPDPTVYRRHGTLDGPEYFLEGRRDGETAPTEEAGIEAEEAASGEEAAVEELPPEEAAEVEGPEESTATEEAAPPDPTVYRRHGTLDAEITNVLIKSVDGPKEADSFSSGERLSVCLFIRFHQEVENPNVGMAVLRQDDGKMIVVYSTNTLRRNMNLGFFKKDVVMEVEFAQRFSLPEGDYYLTVAITGSTDSKDYDWHDNLRSFHIRTIDPDWDGTVDLNSDIIISLIT